MTKISKHYVLVSVKTHELLNNDFHEYRIIVTVTKAQWRQDCWCTYIKIFEDSFIIGLYVLWSTYWMLSTVGYKSSPQTQGACVSQSVRQDVFISAFTMTFM